MTTGVVTFDPAAFKLRYPVFAGVLNPVLQFCFDDATDLLSNSAASVVGDTTKRTRLLWMLTAHIATLTGTLSADGAPLAVGRLNSATEGTVSAGFDYGAVANSEAYYVQTQYGAQFWAATLMYRSFRYYPCPTRPW